MSVPFLEFYLEVYHGNSSSFCLVEIQLIYTMYITQEANKCCTTNFWIFIFIGVSQNFKADDLLLLLFLVHFFQHFCSICLIFENTVTLVYSPGKILIITWLLQELRDHPKLSAVWSFLAQLQKQSSPVSCALLTFILLLKEWPTSLFAYW